MFPTTQKEKSLLHALSVLTLSPGRAPEVLPLLADLDEEGRLEVLSLADSHHVVVRAIAALQATAGGLRELEAWAASALAAERERIRTCLAYLKEICAELEAAQCPVVVMKSLDHWPDLGNDLDLYTDAPCRRLLQVFRERFQAAVEPQSWGDRIANKFNFAVPGLPALVEVHCGRLGQMGEHVALARRFTARRVERELGGYVFPVPAPEERVVVATLQRMYRHFYFRICDILNAAELVESRALDYDELRRASEQAGIWPGVATFLKICSDKMREYRGTGLELPPQVLQASRFGGDKVAVGRRFLRVPIMPYGARLYTEQVTQAALRGDVGATFRLNLLPPLALAAVVAYKVTGSDKGVW